MRRTTLLQDSPRDHAAKLIKFHGTTEEALNATRFVMGNLEQGGQKNAAKWRWWYETKCVLKHTM